MLGLKELQSFLNAKAEKLSRSVVAHLRWDLPSIFRLALAEGYTNRDPTAAEPYINALEQRERLIARLAIFAGIRPGEILALQRRHVSADCRKVRISGASIAAISTRRRPRPPSGPSHSSQDGNKPEGTDGTGARQSRGVDIRVREPVYSDVAGQRVVPAHEAQARNHWA